MDPKLRSICDEVDRAASDLDLKTEGVRRRLERRSLLAIKPVAVVGGVEHPQTITFTDASREPTRRDRSD